MGKIYQIIVVGIQGEKKTVDVATTEDDFNKTTVLEFKKKLVEKLPGNIDPSELRVLYAAKQLEDDDKFSAHGIKDKSTLMLVLRLHGGEKHAMKSPPPGTDGGFVSWDNAKICQYFHVSENWDIMRLMSIYTCGQMG